MTGRGRSAWPPGPDQQVFTTGEVARLCHVNIRTVIRWIDAGQLKGYRIPGSRDRRVTRATLVEFMRAYELPLGVLEGTSVPKKRLLVVDDERAIVDLLVDFFRQQEGFEVESATNAYEAGAQTIAFGPDLLLIDYDLGDATGVDVVRSVRKRPELRDMKIVCMSGIVKGERIAEVLAEGIDDFVEKPIDLKRLLARITKLLGSR